MDRLIEMLLGLPRAFLSREGELSVRFNPVWPGQEVVGAGLWNVVVAGVMGWLILYVYRREGSGGRWGSRGKYVLMGLRALLAGLVLLLLNRPVVTLTQNRVEASVLAVMVDSSLSMRVRDVEAGGANSAVSSGAATQAGGQAAGRGGRGELVSRVEAVRRVLEGAGASGGASGGDGERAGLMRSLLKDHEVRVYGFDRDARLLGTVGGGTNGGATSGVAGTGGAGTGGAGSLGALDVLKAEGQSTALGASLVRVAGDLAGQRLAGIVVMTDGRETPSRPLNEAIARLREAGVKVYPVRVGGDATPRNLAVQNVVVQDAAFKGDLVSVRATVRATGVPAGTRLRVRLTDAKTGRVLPGVGGAAGGSGGVGATTGGVTTGPAVVAAGGGGAEAVVTVGGEAPVEVEIPLRPEEVGDLDLAVTVSAEGVEAGSGAAGSGEIDEEDNTRIARLAVLDAKVNVLYVEGYPRWDYRYLRTELMRDRTVDVSILLTSADSGFAQDGDTPIRRFPESMEELLRYDAVILGDVDPRQFTDGQMQLLADYVGKKGGGLMMVAGQRYAPRRYRGTALEPVLPVSLGALGEGESSGDGADLTAGFRPVVTRAGVDYGVFRFVADRAENEAFLKNDLQRVFWFMKGLAVKPGAGEVLAEHPTELGPDGKKAPVLVAGRYGAGRTLFSAIDDSWRWRYYTGEGVFDTYWVQQIRLLARSRKVGQRLYTLASSRTTYELGETVQVVLRVLETNLLGQLPERVEVEVEGEDGGLLRKESLVRQEDSPGTYVGAFAADRLGRGSVRVRFLAPGAGEAAIPIEVIAPRLELVEVRPDDVALTRLSEETGGRMVRLGEAEAVLPGMIASAAKVIPVESSRPLWDAPLAMALFVLLITAEWVVRKMMGMV